MTRIATLLAGALFAAPVWAQNSDGMLRFEVNAAETAITATVAEPMAMIRGGAVGNFQVLGGEVHGDPGRIESTGYVKFVIDAASYDSGSEGRDQDVKDNALEVAQFPKITFEGRGVSFVERESPDSGFLRVPGKLTLHGVTRDVEIPVKVRIDDLGRLVAEGSYAFRFEDYGVRRPAAMMGLMKTGDEATIEFHVVAERV